jgi:D-alanyl-D-alanine carboxypeptidase (penicillin-binding protein 5/6)
MNKNQIVWEKNMHKAFPVASLTKMMVALLIVEDIKEGKVSWDQKVKVTREATLVTGSKVNLRLGRYVAVRDLMHAAMIASGNDASYLLAQWNGGGSEKNFVNRMNQRATELGMNATRFWNSTGLPNENKNSDNYSSPHDLLKLSAELLKYPEITDISCKPNESICNGIDSSLIRNHNGLVKVFPEVNGLKTGWTKRAGYCIVATSNRSCSPLVSIVLGVPQRIMRNTIVAEMLNDYHKLNGYGCMQVIPDPGVIGNFDNDVKISDN